MTKSEFIATLSAKQNQLAHQDIELAVNCLLEQLSQTLTSGGHIEVRGFGSFSLHYRKTRNGRNPKTGETIVINGKHAIHFKPGKQLRDQINNSRTAT